MTLCEFVWYKFTESDYCAKRGAVIRHGIVFDT